MKPNISSFTDIRDGQTYKSVELGGKIWMAENLNFDVGEGCYFYDDNPRNGIEYGRLYTWEAARNSSPPGWHLPTDEEWHSLAKLYGVLYCNYASYAYNALIEGGRSWFNALLGGGRNTSGNYVGLGKSGRYWSATEHSAVTAWHYYFGYGKLRRYDNLISYGRSCRCLQD